MGFEVTSLCTPWALDLFPFSANKLSRITLDYLFPTLRCILSFLVSSAKVAFVFAFVLIVSSLSEFVIFLVIFDTFNPFLMCIFY